MFGSCWNGMIRVPPVVKLRPFWMIVCARPPARPCWIWLSWFALVKTLMPDVDLIWFNTESCWLPVNAGSHAALRAPSWVVHCVVVPPPFRKFAMPRTDPEHLKGIRLGSRSKRNRVRTMRIPRSFRRVVPYQGSIITTASPLTAVSPSCFVQTVSIVTMFLS